MLEFSKRRRMQIMEQIGDKRDRLPSAERRKLVEKQYNQFVKTMSNFRQADSSLNNSLINKTLNDSQFKNLTKQPQLYLNSPSVKDIVSRQIQQNQSLAKQFYQLQTSPQAEVKIFSPDKLNQVNFYKRQSGQHQNKQIANGINNITQEKSQNHESQLVEDEQIKIPEMFINNSAQTSNNNSEAILFTSQFKEFINKKSQSPLKVQPQQQNKEVQIAPKIEQSEHDSSKKQEVVKWDNTLKNNASGQSLAFSNQSSLKYSLNQSAINEAINKKLANQLVIDSINHFQSSENLIKTMAFRLIIRENAICIVEFTKELRVMRIIEKNRIVNVIDNLMINKEYHFQLKVNEIKANNFIKKTDQTRMSTIFKEWRGLANSKHQKILQFILKRQNDCLNKSFRALKMLLYDRRINNQVDMYYLSKIFYAFKNEVDKESKKANQKAFRLYFKNLRKRMFHHFVEGIYNFRRERDIVEIAEDHYYYSFIGKVFQAWKNACPHEQKFVKLAMTTKNILKQTMDHRLLQTRTYDFYQIK